MWFRLHIIFSVHTVFNLTKECTLVPVFVQELRELVHSVLGSEHTKRVVLKLIILFLKNKGFDFAINKHRSFNNCIYLIAVACKNSNLHLQSKHYKITLYLHEAILEYMRNIYFSNTEI